VSRTCSRETISDHFRLVAHEEEMFEDDPLEYIRQDLEPSTGKYHVYEIQTTANAPIPLENDTRRQAATDFTRALMQLFESQITGIVGGHINNYLQVSGHLVLQCAI
jgi:exportin-2 (importin alpha re-exporter)